MKDYIPVLPGRVKGKDSTYTDVLTLLGLSVDPMTVKNDGRKDPPIAALRIGDKEYALADILGALNTKMGAELPEVTSEDNGDVLAVSGGEWAKQAPPTELPEVTSDDNGMVLAVSGGEWAKQALPMIVTGTTEEGTTTLDTKWGDIFAAGQKGPVMLIAANNTAKTLTVAFLSKAALNSTTYEAYFTNVASAGDEVETVKYEASAEDGYPSHTA